MITPQNEVDNDNENQNLSENTEHAAPYSEQQEKEKEWKKMMSNGKEGNDPTAYRNQGAGGYTQRSDQKDQLENLHIGGAEGVPQGGNEHDDAGEHASGPGFESEGSYELDYQLRTQDQKLDEKGTSGPSKPVED